MRNPRRIVLDDEMIAKHNLSTDPPPPNSLFWIMWNSCIRLAQQALQTPFIQGIHTGTLDPVVYGGFYVNDAYYCFKGESNYQAAAQRTTDPTLQQFLLAKYNSYQKYNATFPKIWHVQDTASIVPFFVTIQYSYYETLVATELDPIYCLIVMLPCEYLWAWLGENLSPPAPQNLYAPWVTDNNNPSGAYAIGNFLDTYQQAHPGVIDQAAAISLYTEAMSYEYQSFVAAITQ